MILIWYPKCSTCQRAKAWLDEHGMQYTLRDIKQQNPSADEIAGLYEKSGLALKRFFNTSGLSYKSMGLKDRLPQMSEQEQIELLATDGMLVKRPILVTEKQVLVGFKEAEWQQLTEENE